MNQIALLALNDVRSAVRDRPAFFWMLVMPIAMMWLFGGIGGGSSGPPTVALTVVNHDDGWLSTAFIEQLDGEQVRITELSPQEAAEAGDKVRTLVVPAGFTVGALAGEQQTVRLEKDADSNAQFGMAAEVRIIRAIVATLGRMVEMQSTAPRIDAGGGLEEFRELARRTDPVTLEVSTAGTGTPVPQGLAQSVPGMMTFVVLMMTLIYGGVLLTVEKQSGMLRRQAGLPMGRRRVFVAKLLGRLIVASIQIVLLVIAGRFLFGIVWGDSIGALALMLFAYATAVAGLSTLLGSLARTPAQASSIGWILAMVLAALGGCWWPTEVMPRWLWTAAHALPTAWAMDGFHALISFGRGIEGVLAPSFALLGFAVAFTMLGARFLRFD